MSFALLAPAQLCPGSYCTIGTFVPAFALLAQARYRPTLPLLHATMGTATCCVLRYLRSRKVF